MQGFLLVVGVGALIALGGLAGFAYATWWYSTIATDARAAAVPCVAATATATNTPPLTAIHLDADTEIDLDPEGARYGNAR